MKIIQRIMPLVAALLYTVVSMCLLLGLYKEQMYEIGCMTPFYYNMTFVREVAAQGFMGCLSLPMMWVCSLMVKPLVGALAVTVIGLLIGWLIFCMLSCKWQYASMAWALPLMIVNFLLQFIFGNGYSFYTTKDLGFPTLYLLMFVAIFFILGFILRPVIRKNKKIQLPAIKYESLGIGFAAMTGIGFMNFYFYTIDPNLKDILVMKHAVDRGDWQKVIDVMEAKEPERVPTRIQVTYTRLALTKLGRAGEDTYSYPDGDAEYKTYSPNQYLRLIAGHQLYYHYGKVNFAYRWCMEDMVEYGMRPHYIAYMLRCARMNGEEKLARKYEKLLRQHPMAKMCKDVYPFSVIDEPEDTSVKQLMNYGNVLDGDGGHVEAYLLQSFATMRGGTREMTRTALDCCLVLKDIDDFWVHFARMVPVWMNEEGGKIPRHYQEAALMFSALQGGQPDVSMLPIKENIRINFDRLVQKAEQNAQYGDDYNAQALKSQYGNTYWYYYFFTKGLKTN